MSEPMISGNGLVEDVGAPSQLFAYDLDHGRERIQLGDSSAIERR
ncbi:MAG: hypothetical protein U0892_05600 [Pirellulales bacterium]